MLTAKLTSKIAIKSTKSPTKVLTVECATLSFQAAERTIMGRRRAYNATNLQTRPHSSVSGEMMLFKTSGNLQYPVDRLARTISDKNGTTVNDIQLRANE